MTESILMQFLNTSCLRVAILRGDDCGEIAERSTMRGIRQMSKWQERCNEKRVMITWERAVTEERASWHIRGGTVKCGGHKLNRKWNTEREREQTMIEEKATTRREGILTRKWAIIGNESGWLDSRASMGMPQINVTPSPTKWVSFRPLRELWSSCVVKTLLQYLQICKL